MRARKRVQARDSSKRSLTPATSVKLGLVEGDVVSLGAVKLPVCVAPGQADDSIAVTLGAMITPHLSHDWEAGRRELVAARLRLFLKLFGFAIYAAAVDSTAPSSPRRGRSTMFDTTFSTSPQKSATLISRAFSAHSR